MPIVFPPKRIGLRRITLFQGVAACDMERIESKIFVAPTAAKSHLIKTDSISEWVYFILNGTVCVYRPQNNGKRVVLNVVGACETLGEICALDHSLNPSVKPSLDQAKGKRLGCAASNVALACNSDAFTNASSTASNLFSYALPETALAETGYETGHTANVVATEDSAIYKIQHADFCELELLLPPLARNIRQLLIRRLRFATAYSEALWPHKVYTRVARLLWALGNRYTLEPAQESVALPLRLAQNEIADWIGASRRHTGESLERLEEEGVIQLRPQYRITLTNLPGLRQCCD